MSRFFGILVAFYWEDHLPPHFHARYAADEGLIEIRTGTVIRGSLPRRALSLIEEWRSMHVEDLLGDWLEDWERARQRQPLAYMPPLE